MHFDLAHEFIKGGHVLITCSACIFFFSSRRRHTRFDCDWSSDVCSSDLFRAEAVTLPAVTPTTLLAMEKAETVAKRGLSFAELSHVEAGHLERLLAGEIQWAMQKMFRQYDAIAHLLLPAELMSQQHSTPAPAASPGPELSPE